MTSGDSPRAAVGTATADNRRTARTVLFAARSATALHRLLDVLPVFAGDDRIARRFTLVPGSDFDAEALTAVERAGARTVPWERAGRDRFDLIVAASPKGALGALDGTLALLPHGAGFGKSLPGEGTPGVASGLDPAFLLVDGAPRADRQLLAHPDQLTRLARASAEAATRAVVVGDPTLERLLASAAHRDRYRAALGTGARRLVALVSTWGPESLLARRPTLATELSGLLPHDAYQVALVPHPNERSRLGSFDLAQALAPAREAGLLLPGPRDEWASLLVAADAVVTDHGATALYAAALGRRVLAAYDGGHELIPESPTARLLAAAPRLETAEALPALLSGPVAPGVAAAADAAFARRGGVLAALRRELYALLGLTPVGPPPEPETLPVPTAPHRAPAAFAVRAVRGVTGRAGEAGEAGEGERVAVERHPTWWAGPVRLFAAEWGVAGQRHVQSAGLLYRRRACAERGAGAHRATWTVDGWIDAALRDHPGCATAGVLLSGELALVRARGGRTLALELSPHAADGRLLHTDPAAALAAAHVLLSERPHARGPFTAVIGDLPFPCVLREAGAEERSRTV
nr:translation initiation factor 2 [Streptomyces zhaozhouensis]